MKIKFLGTSSGWPSPRIGCKCEQCQSTDPKDKRWRSSILVDNILIDAGIDAYHQFIKYNITKIDALIITHTHMDHISGIWDISPRKLYQIKSCPLYALEKNIKLIKRFYPESGYQEKPLQPEDKFEINNLKFKTFPVVHSLERPAMGIIINKKVVYIPDIRMIEKKYEKYIQNID